MLVVLPWWCSVIASLLAYLGLRVVMPAILPENPAFVGLTTALPHLALLVAVILLLPAPFAAFNSYRKRILLDTQSGLETIRALTWKRFEELIAEAYRRKGYKVRENHRGGADGGIDIKLEKDGQIHLVQCKQWKARKIGVSVVREMYGVMVSKSAASVAVITSGTFTREAEDFATGKPVDLIDGARLAALIREILSIPGSSPTQEEPPLASGFGQPNPTSSETCPRCGNALVTKTAKRGKNTGGQFAGCSSFPKCRYTQSV